MPVTMKPTGLRAVAIRALRIVEQMTVRVTKALHAVRTELEGATPRATAEKKVEPKPERTKPARTKPATARRPRRAAARNAA